MSLRQVCLAALCAPLLVLAQTEKVPDTGSTRSINSPVLTLELGDQFGGTNSLLRQRGTAVVAVVVSVRRLSMIERWERDLTERVPGIRFLNIADLPDDARVDPERTAATLRKRVPAGVAVLMDFERRWARDYALDTALPNLLVFDADGRLVDRFRGRWSAGLAADVADAVRRAAAPGTTTGEPVP